MNKYLKWGLRIIGGFLVLILVATILVWLAYNSAQNEIAELQPGNSTVVQTRVGPVEYLKQGYTDRYILYLHGSPGNYRTFNTNLLLNKGYSIISVSRPGYYRTPLRVGASLEGQADAFAALLDELAIDNVSVLGFSGGGPPALEFAIKYPNRVKGLVMIAPVSKQMVIPEGPNPRDMFGNNFTAWAASQAFMAQFHDNSLKEMAKPYLYTTVMPVEDTEDGRENDFSIFTSDFTQQADSLEVPTIIIHGTIDDVIPHNDSVELAERIPNAQLVSLEGKDHFQVVFFEYEETLRIVSDFLMDITGNLNEPSSN